MSIAQFTSLNVAGNAALDAGDYAAAILVAMKAKLLLGTTPNLAREIGSGSQSITWNDGTAIKDFIHDCRALERAANVGSAGVFGQSAVTYARPTA